MDTAGIVNQIWLKNKWNDFGANALPILPSGHMVVTYYHLCGCCMSEYAIEPSKLLKVINDLGNELNDDTLIARIDAMYKVKEIQQVHEV